MAQDDETGRRLGDYALMGADGVWSGNLSEQEQVAARFAYEIARRVDIVGANPVQDAMRALDDVLPVNDPVGFSLVLSLTLASMGDVLAPFIAESRAAGVDIDRAISGVLGLEPEGGSP